MFFSAARWAFFCLLISASFLYAADPAERKQGLERDLAKTRSELASAQASMTEDAKALFQKQHELEYSDPGLAKLREEIVALEKQILEKRKELNLRVSLNPEMKDIEAQRRELFQNIQRLKDEEQAILNELKALDYAAELPKSE